MGKYSTYPLGIDVSFWQGVNDWDKIAARAKFAFIRAGQDRFPDAKFTLNWNASQGKLPRGAYWFYDWRRNASTTEEQAALFRSLGVAEGELPPVMDFEDPYSSWSDTPFPNRDAALDLIRRFRDGVIIAGRMILYCNSSTLKKWQPFPAWLTDEFDLWIAAYPYATGSWNMTNNPDQIPDAWYPATYGWDYKFWQFTPKLPGKLYGVGSGDLDGDLFNGTQDELNDYTGSLIVSDAEKLNRLWDAHPGLHG